MGRAALANAGVDDLSPPQARSFGVLVCLVSMFGRLAAGETLLLQGFAAWSPLYLLQGRSDIRQRALGTLR
jgi:hypothetical protein